MSALSMVLLSITALFGALDLGYLVAGEAVPKTFATIFFLGVSYVVWRSVRRFLFCLDIICFSR